MMKDEKSPRSGVDKDKPGVQPPHAARETKNGTSGSRDAASQECTRDDRDIKGLLRMLGWQDGNDHPLTDEEAEVIFEIAERESTSEERLERLRAGVLQRRFGTTPAADNDSGPVDGTDASSRSAQSAAVQDPTASTDTRPSIVRHCRALKRDLGAVASQLHLDPQTLFELDRGAAVTVPKALIDSAATVLALDRREVARCFAARTPGVSRMAAHGRSGAQATETARLRTFVEIIDASKLPDEAKRYWHHVVVGEQAAAGRSEKS